MSTMLGLVRAAVFLMLPSPFLPPLLVSENSTAITNIYEWHRLRRPEVSALVQDILLGRLPPDSTSCSSPPALLDARVVNSTVHNGSTDAFVNLTFGVRGPLAHVNVSFVIELLQPAQPSTRRGVERAPVFLTQWTHRPWAMVALERGYIGVVYPGADCHPNGARSSILDRNA